jgi:hypothetical protein
MEAASWVAQDDPDPKTLACYGLLARCWDAAGRRSEELWLRFVKDRPVSAVLLIWDNASGHDSPIVAGGEVPAQSRH